MEKIEYAIAMRGLDLEVSECGDIGFVKEFEDLCLVCLIDVLGHGEEARNVALKAVEYLELNYQNMLADIICGLHEHLKGTRGAVAFFYLLDIQTGHLQYSGIGNVTARIFGLNPVRLVSKDGIIGYNHIRPVIKETNLYDKDILLLHSDGIKEHFDAIECRDILMGDADSIASGILNRYGTKMDDASCIALKYFS